MGIFSWDLSRRFQREERRTGKILILTFPQLFAPFRLWRIPFSSKMFSCPNPEIKAVQCNGQRWFPSIMQYPCYCKGKRSVLQRTGHQPFVTVHVFFLLIELVCAERLPGGNGRCWLLFQAKALWSRKFLPFLQKIPASILEFQLFHMCLDVRVSILQPEQVQQIPAKEPWQAGAICFVVS